MVEGEFVVASGDYIGVWVKNPKCWNSKSFSKVTVPRYIASRWLI